MFKKVYHKIRRENEEESENELDHELSANNKFNRSDRKAPLKKRLVLTHSECDSEETESSTKKQRGKPLKLYRLEERRGLDVLSNLSYRIEIDHSIKELDDIMAERKSDTHRLKSSQITILRRTVHTVNELLNLSRQLKQERRRLKKQVKEAENMSDGSDSKTGLDYNYKNTGLDENIAMLPCPYAFSNMTIGSPSSQYICYQPSVTQQTTSTYSTLIHHFPSAPF